MPSRNYTDLIAWQKAMDLARATYTATSAFPSEERFGITAQMRRAAVSIPANIAEGEGRRTRGEFLNQLSIAHGSVRELETHLRIAITLAYLDGPSGESLLNQAAEVGKLVTGLTNFLKRERQDE